MSIRVNLKFANIYIYKLISHNRLKQNDCIFKFPNKNRIISIARLGHCNKITYSSQFHIHLIFNFYLFTECSS